MFGLLDLIAKTVAAFGQLVLWAVVSAVNLIIAGLGGLLGVVLAVLPGLPDPLDNPAPDAIGWIAWFFPAGPVLAFAVLLMAAYVALLLWRVVMRWVKAL